MDDFTNELETLKKENAELKEKNDNSTRTAYHLQSALNPLRAVLPA